jgi:hypothetical protein
MSSCSLLVKEGPWRLAVSQSPNAGLSTCWRRSLLWTPAKAGDSLLRPSPPQPTTSRHAKSPSQGGRAGVKFTASGQGSQGCGPTHPQLLPPTQLLTGRETEAQEIRDAPPPSGSHRHDRVGLEGLVQAAHQRPLSGLRGARVAGVSRVARALHGGGFHGQRVVAAAP